MRVREREGEYAGERERESVLVRESQRESVRVREGECVDEREGVCR